jgi:hypothetical protein
VMMMKTLPLPISGAPRQTINPSAGWFFFDRRFVEDEVEEGSKGTRNPLRAYAMASSGPPSTSFPPEV